MEIDFSFGPIPESRNHRKNIIREGQGHRSNPVRSARSPASAVGVAPQRCPYPPGGYWNNYHILNRQFKRSPVVVVSNERTWVNRISDHAEREYLSLSLHCATVPRLV
jgi:hypothetical protein